LADLLEVDVETAPLVELALGGRAQHFVVESLDPWIDERTSSIRPTCGSVGLIPLHAACDGDAAADDSPELSDTPGVFARADRLVRSAPELEAVVHRLLGRVWIVDDLEAARRAAAKAPGATFVTRGGEVLGGD